MYLRYFKNTRKLLLLSNIMSIIILPFFSVLFRSVPFPQVLLYWTNAFKVHAFQAKSTTRRICYVFRLHNNISNQPSVSRLPGLLASEAIPVLLSDKAVPQRAVEVGCQQTSHNCGAIRDQLGFEEGAALETGLSPVELPISNQHIRQEAL